MSNPNEHIEDFLKYFFKLQNPPHYAVLLKGKWGVGKTWFLKSFLKSLESPHYNVKQYLYISLYGITDTKQIETELFRQLHPLLSSEGMKLATKIGKGLLKATIKLDLDNDDKSDGSISLQVPDIKLSDYLSKTDGLVLIFDDLERASMDSQTLLGYINHYVEHQGYKVILIANEEELLKVKRNINSDEVELINENIGYRRIKEKLIGKTFQIQPNLELVIKNFIQEIASETTKQFYMENFDLIKDLYQSSGYWNLRHLKQALMDFARFYKLMSEKIRRKDGIMAQLFSIYLMLSFEIKSGEILATNISDIRSSHIESLMNKDKAVVDKNDEYLYDKLRKKYTQFDLYDKLLEDEVWTEIFDKGILNKDIIEDSLLNSHYFLDEKQPEWVKLWHFLYLADSDFEIILKNVKSKFIKLEYKDFKIIKHILGIFLKFSDEGLIDLTKSEVLNIAKLNVDKLLSSVDNALEVRNSPLEENNSYGLGYNSIDSKEFKELDQYIKIEKKKKTIDNLPLLGEVLLNSIEDDIQGFISKIVYDGKDNTYNNHPILSYIKPSDFVKALLRKEPGNRRDIILAVSSRYKECRNLKKLFIEIYWLQEVVKLLLSEAENRKGKVSGYQIKIFTNAYFIPSIAILHHENLKKWQAKYYRWEPATSDNLSDVKAVSFLYWLQLFNSQ